MTDNLSGLLSSLWRASWQGAIAFALIWVLCRVLARRLSADAHCWLWRLSYLKLLIGLLWGGAILVPLLAPAPHPVSAVQPQIALPSAYTPSALPLKAATTAEPIIHVEDKAKDRLSWQEALATLYLLGVIFCLGRLLLAAWENQAYTPLNSFGHFRARGSFHREFGSKDEDASCSLAGSLIRRG